jgi:hypothetical protein
LPSLVIKNAILRYMNRNTSIVPNIDRFLFFKINKFNDGGKF